MSLSTFERTLPGVLDTPSSISAEVVAHHLRLFGVIGAGSREGSNPLVINAAGSGEVSRAHAGASRGATVIALQPSPSFLVGLGISSAPAEVGVPFVATAIHARAQAWGRLRSLHSAVTINSNAMDAIPLVQTEDGLALWSCIQFGEGFIVFIGTDLAADLVRYRQGDPAAVEFSQSREMWGFAGERPVFLFEKQLAGEAAHERHADWWCWALRDTLIRHCGMTAKPILPKNAPGAVVVTGDDDQAQLESYDKQTQALGTLPITYFLHPLTKHDRGSLENLCRGRRVELGLHPDALDAPASYAMLFAEQAAWFKRLTSKSARTVRNHGFLNDGYWGHLHHWRAAGIIGSSNLPGVDGRVLNGSLLPARIAIDGGLTDHWSILTAIGDGVLFVSDIDEHGAAAIVHQLGDRVRHSGVPGVIVLNLHPDNIERSRAMHVAVRDLVDDGFVAWTLCEMIDWFNARDAGVACADVRFEGAAHNKDRQGWLSRLFSIVEKYQRR